MHKVKRQIGCKVSLNKAMQDENIVVKAAVNLANNSLLHKFMMH